MEFAARCCGRGLAGSPSKVGVGSMLLVVGGTGELGGRVVRLLVDRGVDVRCLVRDGARLDGVEVVRGDLRDAASLRKACEGVETVVATATAIARRLAGVKDASIRETDEAGMLALVDAATESGVQRFIFVSYAGLDGHIGVPLEHAKLAVEDRLKHSGLRSVIVRPDAFQEIHLGPLARFDLANGKVSVIGTGKAKVRWVSTDDVAALIASVAIDPDPPSVIEFGGPEGAQQERGDHTRGGDHASQVQGAAPARTCRSLGSPPVEPPQRRAGVLVRCRNSPVARRRHLGRRALAHKGNHPTHHHRLPQNRGEPPSPRLIPTVRKRGCRCREDGGRGVFRC